MTDNPQTTPVFQKHWIRTFGKIEGFLMRIFGKTIEMPSGNRITWWRGKAYVWERRVYHCGEQHEIELGQPQDVTKW